MILVVGATGRLGGAIAQRLLDEGHEVRVLVRAGSDDRALVEAGAMTVSGDLKRPESLAPACTGVDAIVTTANAAGRAAPDTFESVDDRGNQHLIDAAVRAGVDRFVFVSALGADPESSSPLLRAKGRTEARLRSSPLRFTVLQPDVYMDLLIPMVLGPAVAGTAPVPLVLGGNRRHSFVALADVAAFATAAIRGGVEGETIPVGGPQAISWRDIVRAAEDVLGRSIATKTAEAGVPLPGLPPFATGLLAMLEMFDSSVDANAAARALQVDLTPIGQWMEGFLSVRAIPAPSA